MFTNSKRSLTPSNNVSESFPYEVINSWIEDVNQIIEDVNQINNNVKQSFDSEENNITEKVSVFIENNKLLKDMLLEAQTSQRMPDLNEFNLLKKAISNNYFQYFLFLALEFDKNGNYAAAFEAMELCLSKVSLEPKRAAIFFQRFGYYALLNNKISQSIDSLKKASIYFEAYGYHDEANLVYLLLGLANYKKNKLKDAELIFTAALKKYDSLSIKEQHDMLCLVSQYSAVFLKEENSKSVKLNTIIAILKRWADKTEDLNFCYPQILKNLRASYLKINQQILEDLKASYLKINQIVSDINDYQMLHTSKKIFRFNSMPNLSFSQSISSKNGNNEMVMEGVEFKRANL